MLTAAINSATHLTHVALVNNGKLLAEKSWMSRKDEAERILPNLSALLLKTKKKWSDIDEVFVIAGPGPFTGLRVGVTVANVLGWTTGSRLKSADIFDYLAARLPLKMAQNTAILIKAGGDHVALLLPRSKTEKIVSLENLPAALKKAKIKNLLAEVKPEDLIMIKKILKTNAGLKFVSSKNLKTSGEAMVELILRTKKHAKLVQPLYLQKPHITRSKKEVFTATK